jgi:hypothetical protein
MGIWRKLFGSDQGATVPPQAQTSLDSRQGKNVKEVDSNNNTEKEDLQMQNELITSDNLSPELLKSVFDSAFMEATLDDDGEVIVQDAIRVRVRANMERKDRIRFISIFGFKDDSKPLSRLECVNRINSEYVMVRAVSYENSAHEKLLIFDYDFWIVGGITKKALVMALKQFATIPHDAVADHGQGIVE